MLILSGGSVNSFYPGPRNAPLGKDKWRIKYMKQLLTRRSFQRPPRVALFVWLSLDWARNSPYIDWVRVRGSCWTFIPKGQSSSQC